MINRRYVEEIQAAQTSILGVANMLYIGDLN